MGKIFVPGILLGPYRVGERSSGGLGTSSHRRKVVVKFWQDVLGTSPSGPAGVAELEMNMTKACQNGQAVRCLI